MSQDSPAPAPDDSTPAAGAPPAQRTRESYALRHATLLLAVLVVAAGLVAFMVSRGDDDDERSTLVVAPRAWDTAALVDQATERVVVVDADGVEIAAGAGSLDGAIDVGLDGAIVIGTAGVPSVDGLGVLDLESGRTDVLRVAYDRVSVLGDGPLLTVDDGAGVSAALQVVDPVRREVRDLATFAGPDAVVLTDAGLASPSGTTVALTDLHSGRTLLLDVGSGRTVAVPGRVADLSDDRVATITDRGDTMLVDLTDLEGTRLGTVETAPLAAVWITGPDEAISVGSDGVIGRLRFSDGEFEETARLGTDTAPVVVGEAALVAARQRLAVTVAGLLVLVDRDGKVADSVATSIGRPLIDRPAPGARCVHLVGTTVEPSLIIDTTNGDRLATVGPGTVLDRSADGCVVVTRELGSSASIVTGDDIEVELRDPLLAIAPDGTAVIVGGARTRLIRLDDLAETRLPRTAQAAAFGRLGADDAQVPGSSAPAPTSSG